MEQVIEWGQFIFAAVGFLASAVYVVVRITDGEDDDNWFKKYILPFLPAIIGADKANKMVGRGRVTLRELKELRGQIKELRDKVPKGD